MPAVIAEKAALVATLRQADPDAATLCAGWDVRRLLAHLVQREQDPRGLVGDALARRPPGGEPGLSRLTGAAGSAPGYQDLVSRFAAGPPRWSPMSWAAENINLVEYVIHHEDVRRGGLTPAEPRPLPPEQQSAIWAKLPVLSRLAFRRSPVGVSLARPSGETQVAKRGDPGVVLIGPPVELALYVSGRRYVAHVEVSGPADAVTRFESWTAKL